jgi:flagellar hook assembly protein FlgD
MKKLIFTYGVMLLIFIVCINSTLAQKYTVKRWTFASGGVVNADNGTEIKQSGIVGQLAIGRIVVDKTSTSQDDTRFVYQGFLAPVGDQSSSTDVTEQNYDELNVSNYPNPFTSITNIKYYLKAPSKVNIRIYDVSGKVVRDLFDGVQDPGKREVQWDGKNNEGFDVSSATYIVEISLAPVEMAGDNAFVGYSVRHPIILTK